MSENKNMIKALERMTEIIKEYRSSDVIKEQNGEQLNDWLKDLTGILFYLEKERSKYHNKFERLIFDLVNKDYTVARAENWANVKIPEMYMLRRIMDAAYKVADAMRTNISYLKNERIHSQ